MRIGIIDYGAGNILSIKNMINRLGFESFITNDPIKIKSAEKIILPGVGNYDFGMSKIQKLGITESLKEMAIEKQTPILGICLGAQLMCNSSEEGVLPGLGFFDASVVRFDKSRLINNQKIPHMGWNEVKLLKESILFNNFPDSKRFYFVHSYHFFSNDKEIALCETTYGYPFLAALQSKNIFAVQFHPEKSHKFGMKMIQNFLTI